MADQATEGLLSPYLREKRFGAALPYLKGKVLDFGCGSGGLAKYIHSNDYLGIEIDGMSLKRAHEFYPHHRFQSSLNLTEKFDSIVSLAVIEHVKDAGEFLKMLSSYLEEDSDASIIISTPHPCIEWLHEIGAKAGLFSKHANEEHEDLLNRSKLKAYGAEAELDLYYYGRFLFGVNQIAIFKRKIR